MRKLVIVVAAVILSLGCARVRVEAPKDPIKIDVSMRLDIYQHVSKDISDIESIVGSAHQNSTAADSHSMLEGFVSLAYAQEALSPEVESAALRRRDRVAELKSWESKGVLGENSLGMVDIRKAESLTPQLENLISQENSDRLVIYKSIAQKNGTNVVEIEKLYSKRLQQDAPSGTPIQIEGNWEVKP